MNPSSGKLAVNLALLVLAAGFVVPLLWRVLAAFDGRAGAADSWPHPRDAEGLRRRPDLRPDLPPNDQRRHPVRRRDDPCGARLGEAHPLTRYQFCAKRPLLLTILFATGLPITAVMVPV